MSTTRLPLTSTCNCPTPLSKSSRSKPWKVSLTGVVVTEVTFSVAVALPVEPLLSVAVIVMVNEPVMA